MSAIFLAGGGWPPAALGAGKMLDESPYGREIGRWVEKALKESQRGARVVCLVPARTDSAWFQDMAAQGSVIFIRGRIQFQGAPSAAPFPSALVIFPQIAPLGVIARWP
jgi:site-specific DNA-methyltransferase (adenine-specific)